MSTGKKRAASPTINLADDEDLSYEALEKAFEASRREVQRIRNLLHAAETKNERLACATLILSRQAEDFYVRYVKPNNFVCACLCEGEIPESERRQPQFQFPNCNHYICFECMSKYVNDYNSDAIKCPLCGVAHASLKLVHNSHFRATYARLPAFIKNPPAEFDLDTVIHNAIDEHGTKLLSEPVQRNE